MNIKINPKNLSGSIKIPPSKSISHRALICAALADGESRLTNVLGCSDIDATRDALIAMGADIREENGVTIVRGIKDIPENVEIDCIESGSTLRFLIPIVSALGIYGTFSGTGHLPNRPITPFLDAFPENGVDFLSDKMPYVTSGKLRAGKYRISGDISSQFITGLLFALPLLDGNSEIILTSPLQSKPYADITVNCLKSFGIETLSFDDSYSIKGNQKYRACSFDVEGDYSQAAFFIVANKLGSSISVEGINANSVQGDKEITNIVDSVITIGQNYSAIDVDATNIPDLVPILTVLAAFADGTSRIRGCKRLRLKESDRLLSISTVLNSLGAHVCVVDDELEIVGVKELSGGVADSFNDHRIAMSLAIASQRCKEPLIITNAECVAKSYPTFFDDFRVLGGDFDVI